MVAWFPFITKRISCKPTVSLKRFILPFHVGTTFRFNRGFVLKWQLIWGLPYHPNSPGNIILFSQCSQNSLKLIWAASVLSQTETQHNKIVEKGHLWDHLFPNFSLLSMATLSFSSKSGLHSSWLGERKTSKGEKRREKRSKLSNYLWEPALSTYMHITSGCHLISVTCFTKVTKHG